MAAVQFLQFQERRGIFQLCGILYQWLHDDAHLYGWPNGRKWYLRMSQRRILGQWLLPSGLDLPLAYHLYGRPNGRERYLRMPQWRDVGKWHLPSGLDLAFAYHLYPVVVDELQQSGADGLCGEMHH